MPACPIFCLAASEAAIKLPPVMIWRFLLPVSLLVVIAGCGKKSSETTAPKSDAPLPEPPLIANVEPGQYGGRLVIAEFGEPKTFNPVTANESSSTDIIRFLFGSLTMLDLATQEVGPYIAESWSVAEDQKTWTFKMRKGVLWSDGKPLTADDVVFTWNDVIYNPKINNVVRDLFQIRGKQFKVTKIDDYTIQAVTPEIYAPMVLNFGSVLIVPKHILAVAVQENRFESIYGINTPPEQIVGSGPYKVKEYKPGQHVMLERNPRYLGVDSKQRRLPYLNNVIWTTVPDFNAMALRTLRGESDLQDVVRPDEITRFQEEEKKGRIKLLDLGTQMEPVFLWFNQNTNVNAKTSAPFVAPHKLKWFRNQKFRQAISYAIDRDSVVKSVYAGRAVPNYGILTPANKKWYNPNIATFPFNLEKAKALLAELGIKDRNNDGILEDEAGNKVEFTLNTNTGNTVRERISVLIQEDLKRLGVQLTFQPLEFNTLIDRMNTSYEYDALLLVVGGDSTDPSSGMNVWKSEGFTHLWFPRQKTPSTEWEARLDELMDLQITTLKYDERKKYFDEVQAILAEQQPVISIVASRAYAAIRSDIGNVKPTVVSQQRVSWNAEELYFKKK
jgi:peptide/nickel transport system substrate-binding protein